MEALFFEIQFYEHEILHLIRLEPSRRFEQVKIYRIQKAYLRNTSMVYKTKTNKFRICALGFQKDKIEYKYLI